MKSNNISMVSLSITLSKSDELLETSQLICEVSDLTDMVSIWWEDWSSIG